MARACGSYPQCRWFAPNRRYQLWPGGQAAKTPPFHGGNASPILARVTISYFCAETRSFGCIAQLVRAFASHARGLGFESRCVHHGKNLESALGFCRVLLFYRIGRDLNPQKEYGQKTVPMARLPLRTEPQSGPPARKDSSLQKSGELSFCPVYGLCKI